MLEDLLQTNNCCEGFHTAISSILEAAHPTIYILIGGFKDQQSLTGMKIQQMIAGNIAPQSKQYLDLAKKFNVGFMFSSTQRK